VAEAQEKVRLGMYIFIREATNAHNLDTLLPLVTPENTHRWCLCLAEGHQNPVDSLNCRRYN
jgi:adenine deaminase